MDQLDDDDGDDNDGEDGEEHLLVTFTTMIGSKLRIKKQRYSRWLEHH